jgi:hypothetical protein
MVNESKDPVEIEVLPLGGDIKAFPEFMQYLYRKKLRGALNLTMSEGLEKEITEWQLKEEQATEVLNSL